MPIKVEQNIHQGHMLQTLDDVGDWINRTHNNLIAAGLLQTADTGQVVGVSGATATPSTSTFHGYRVYELNDAFSGTVPVYIRLEFRSINASSGGTIRAPQLTVGVGFATDGAGNLQDANYSKALKQYQAISSSSPVLNPNARTLTVKGDDFLFHGNELVTGYQTSNNIYEGGHFAVLRSKINGVVDPTVVTFIFNRVNAAASHNNLLPWGYVRLTKDNGASSENTHMFRLPRIRTFNGLTVAAEADISESSVLETTDRFVCMRTAIEDIGWSEFKLSTNGLSNKTYLQLPCSNITSNSAPSGVDKLFLTAVVDAIEPGFGCIGVLISE